MSRTLPLTLVVSLALVVAQPLTARAGDLLVYDDALQNGFEDWSFGVHDLASTTHVRTGATSISFEPSSWDGIYFHRDAGIDPDELGSLEFWLHGGDTGGQADIRIALLVNDSDVVNTDVLPFVPGNAIVPGWQHVVIPFDAFPVTEVMDGFWLQAWTDAVQDTLWIDDISIVARVAGCEPGNALDLDVAAEGASLRLTWTSADMADEHVVRSDADAAGDFATIEARGASGLTIPMAADALRCYLIAGVNACGEGDLRGETP